MNSQSPSHRPSPRQRGFINKPFLGAVAILAGLVAFGTSFLAIGAGSPVTTPPINLSSDPLYAVNVKDKPTMALALSVEYPTVGAQYVNVPNTNSDDSYANTKEYLGYYDAESCYRYNDAPTETPESGRTAADYKRFDPIGKATNRKCSDAFSGNFLNWATNSAVDMLRLALSGGDRYVDTSTLTILQRAVLPNGDPICMWNSNNFPAKRLAKDGGGANSYWGAVPNAMVTGANGNDIWVANTLNRVYFRAGSSAVGSCTDTSGYTLGAPAATQSRGTTTSVNNAPLPSEAVLCTVENAMCNFTGVREVWFGVPPSLFSPRQNWAVVPAANGINCNYQVIGDPAPGQSKSCYTRPYTGTWQPPQSTALNSDGFFYSRVQVCNKTGDQLQDVRDYGLCTQYPSSNYKPVGVIQKYSDQLRLAAFGYLMDQTASYNNGRYGGVLRAPMKYVGQKTFDVLGREETATNAKVEWDISTGIFNKNPESDNVFGISGVINYLNQFGRTGPVPGRYKIYDPVGELYYQSLRYMQGLPPTGDAISGLGTPSTGSALYDGYPVYTDWTNIDPYGGSRSATESYSCVRSNIVVIGDINTHDGNWRNIPSSDDPANNATNFRTWHQVVQSFEKGTSMSYVDGQGVNRTTSNPNTPNPNVPSSTQTSQIMGYAYWAHTQDIRGTRWTAAPTKQRPGLRVKTFLFDVNEYAAQNDTTTRQTRNQFFMAAKYGGFTSTSPDPKNSDVPFNSYGNPFRSQAKNLDNPDNNVWQKQNAAGEASTYYLQSDARGVLAAFQAIFESASGGARSIAGSASLSTVQANTDNFLYSAKFDVASWTGDVIAEQITRVDDGTSVRLAVATTPTWSAAARLKAKNAADRKIYAGHGSRQAATEFTWTGINGKPMQTSLSKASPSAVADSLGPDRLNYLRGVRTNQGAGAQFRGGSELLGDIVNSGVTFSGAPSAAFTGNSYALFKTDNAARSPVVFAGANDGMLHAFAAQTDTGKGITAGDELFAYIPSWMGPKLSALTSPTYVNNHQAYVDAPSAVGEAQVAFTAGAGDKADWKTVLVSGTGAGGRGVFALDVSKPESFAAGNAMWEFTGADDADMGFVVGRPQILKFRTGANTYRWFAVVASGADNYTSTFDNGGGGGRPALFLLALDKATGAAWVEGTNYFKLIFPVDTALAATVATGMANFTPLYARGGEVTQIYAADLHGKVWKLDFTCTKASADDTSCTYGYKATSNWTVAGLSSFGSGGTPYPFFIAKDASGNTQPITSAPQLFTGPIVNGQETFYVVIGTGKYLESSDRTSTRTQSVYALYDNGSPTLDSSTPAAAISGRGRMSAGTVDTSARTVSIAAFKWGRPASDGDTTQRAGWYIDLPSSGERSISGFTDLGGLNVAFSTVIPGDIGAAGSCSTNPGSGRQYTIDVGAGTGTTADSQVGLLSAFVVIEDTASSTVTNYDSTGQAVRTIMKRSLQTGSSGVAEGKSSQVQEVVGRLSWRQIYDYRQLRKDATTP